MPASFPSASMRYRDSTSRNCCLFRLKPAPSLRWKTVVARPGVLVWLLALTGCGASYEPVDASRQLEQGVANTGQHRARELEGALDNGVERRTRDAPVRATLKLARARARAGERIELAVRLNVAPLWEIRTLAAEPRSAATRLELELPSGVKAVGGWQAPEPSRSLMPDGHAAYAGEIVFTRPLLVTDAAAAGEHQIQCSVAFQACNQRQCLTPAAIDLAVPLHIE